MLEIIAALGAIIIVSLWAGLWIYDRMQEPAKDPYDNPDNWGERP